VEEWGRWVGAALCLWDRRKAEERKGGGNLPNRKLQIQNDSRAVRGKEKTWGKKEKEGRTNKQHLLSSQRKTGYSRM